MRILLINVCLRYDSLVKHIPVGLACIATALNNAGFRADILDIDLYRYNDKEVDDFLKKNNYYDVVGLGNIVSGYKHTKRLALQVKKAMPETLLVVGNTVATSIPELLLKCVPQIDIAVIGEGDITIIEIVKAIEEKINWKAVAGIAYRNEEKVIFTEEREPIQKMDDIPFPDYSLFEVERYLSISNLALPAELSFSIPFQELRALPLNTARGCLFSCTFCNHAFKKYKYRYYSIEMVVNQIKYLQERYKVNHINFWDELTFFSMHRLSEFCESTEKAKLAFSWSIDTRANVFTWKDLDLLKRSRDLGALQLGCSIESADPGILKAMNKRISVERFIEQVQVAKKAGLNVVTSLVLGYPQETKETIERTFQLCGYLGIYPSAGFLLPVPGTPIYEYAIKEGLIKNEEEYLLRIGDRQDLHINLTQMPDEIFFNIVKEGLIKLKNELNIPIPDDKVIKTSVYKVSKK